MMHASGSTQESNDNIPKITKKRTSVGFLDLLSISLIFLICIVPYYVASKTRTVVLSAYPSCGAASVLINPLTAGVAYIRVFIFY